MNGLERALRDLTHQKADDATGPPEPVPPKLRRKIRRRQMVNMAVGGVLATALVAGGVLGIARLGGGGGNGPAGSADQGTLVVRREQTDPIYIEGSAAGARLLAEDGAVVFDVLFDYQNDPFVERDVDPGTYSLVTAPYPCNANCIQIPPGPADTERGCEATVEVRAGRTVVALIHQTAEGCTIEQTEGERVAPRSDPLADGSAAGVNWVLDADRSAGGTCLRFRAEGTDERVCATGPIEGFGPVVARAYALGNAAETIVFGVVSQDAASVEVTGDFGIPAELIALPDGAASFQAFYVVVPGIATEGGTLVARDAAGSEIGFIDFFAEPIE